MKKYLATALFLLLTAGLPPSAFAEVKTIEVGSGYVMGDNDSKIMARKIATQEAQRKALEHAGTFVETLTIVKDYKLTKDEITAYTAGVIETKVLKEEMRGTAEKPEIYINVRCKIDTDVLMKQIERYRESEELKEQLMVAAQENETLKKERAKLISELSREKDKTRADDTRKRLDLVLAKAESNDETAKVWNNYALREQFGEGQGDTGMLAQAELDNASATLNKAVRINPENQRARVMLAAIYRKEGKLDAAEHELRKVLKHHPNNPYARMQYGRILRERGMYREALEEFRAVEQRRPGGVHMLFQTGMTYKSLGECEPTLSYLSRFMRKTRHDRRPKFKRMRRKAAKVIRACGGHPERRPPRDRPPRRQPSRFRY
ncbi:MAG TPA: hypothetical protein DCO77_07655 [Nitrospiraceae bacterium]|nr:hypothetical protein [Nitrospiraceae bacterium]